MRRLFLILFAVAATLSGANFKLYLKDGSYQLVREYKVEADKVRYYSVERGDWEEIPLAMVDLKRTETEAAGRKAKLTPAPMPDADVAYTYADISKARRLLGYDPRVSAEEGVRRFGEWYRRAVLKNA